MLLRGQRVVKQRSTDAYLKHLIRRHRSVFSHVIQVDCMCVRQGLDGSVCEFACDWTEVLTADVSIKAAHREAKGNLEMFLYCEIPNPLHYGKCRRQCFWRLMLGLESLL